MSSSPNPLIPKNLLEQLLSFYRIEKKAKEMDTERVKKAILAFEVGVFKKEV